MHQKLLHQFLKSVQSGSFTLEDWTGKQTKYGTGPSEFTLIIKNKNVVPQLIKNTSLAFGEGYANGDIEVIGDVHDVVALANRNIRLLRSQWSKINWLTKMRGVTKGATKTEQRQDIQHHYDLGNDFYSLWLDPTMSYSCAYFSEPNDSLEQAQHQKIDHILKKLLLKPGDTLLDIGSGWGWLIVTAAKKYKVKTKGITLSKEQFAKTQERIKTEGLEKLVSVELKDYRELNEQNAYDRIVSVGMFEHVGRPNHGAYFSAVERLLKPGGISLLHTITTDHEHPTDPWIQKYIFPGGYIPSWREVIQQLPNHSFHLTDAESLRMHYAITLDHWAKNYEKHRKTIEQKYGENFVRMWRLYLRASAASFRTSGLDLHQFVFTKGLNNQLPLTRAYMADAEKKN